MLLAKNVKILFGIQHLNLSARHLKIYIALVVKNHVLNLYPLIAIVMNKQSGYNYPAALDWEYSVGGTHIRTQHCKSWNLQSSTLPMCQ